MISNNAKLPNGCYVHNFPYTESYWKWNFSLAQWNVRGVSSFVWAAAVGWIIFACHNLQTGGKVLRIQFWYSSDHSSVEVQTSFVHERRFFNEKNLRKLLKFFWSSFEDKFLFHVFFLLESFWSSIIFYRLDAHLLGAHYCNHHPCTITLSQPWESGPFDRRLFPKKLSSSKVGVQQSLT